MIIRPEAPADTPEIRALIADAFRVARLSSGREAAIVDALRDSGALTLSLVAEDGGELAGHAAFSPVTIDEQSVGWFGLGPVAVRPGQWRRGIGKALIVSGLERIKDTGARGCVVLGDPAFYGQFGFKSDPRLVLADVRADYFQQLSFGGPVPAGLVAYHPAFSGG